MIFDRIACGTASIGINDYGVNRVTKLDDPIIFLKKIRSLGVSSFDTAPTYGNAEKLLGNALYDELRPKLKIFTKVNGLIRGDSSSKSKIYSSVDRSCSDLRTDYLDVLYLHQNEIEIFTDKYIINTLCEMKDSRKIKEIGVSVYSHEELMIAESIGIYDWIQVPANLLDMSFILKKNQNSAAKLAVRSIFLQGAIFLDQSRLIDFPDSKKLIMSKLAIERLVHKFGLQLDEMTILMLLSLKSVSQVILGSRLECLWNRLKMMSIEIHPQLYSELLTIAEDNKKWTNPRLWNLKKR